MYLDHYLLACYKRSVYLSVVTQDPREVYKVKTPSTQTRFKPDQKTITLDDIEDLDRFYLRMI